MKKSILSIIVLWLIIFMSGCSNNQTFNDVTSMEAKIAKELDTKQVSIFDSQDIGEYRFVGYTFNNQYGFAAFKQNGKGDYVLDIVKEADKLIPRAQDIAVGYHDDYWIAVSNNENLNTIKFKMKTQADPNYKNVNLEVKDNPSISVLKLPYEDYFETGEYNFYDGEGNLIK